VHDQHGFALLAPVSEGTGLQAGAPYRNGPMTGLVPTSIGFAAGLRRCAPPACAGFCTTSCLRMPPPLSHRLFAAEALRSGACWTPGHARSGAMAITWRFERVPAGVATGHRTVRMPSAARWETTRAARRPRCWKQLALVAKPAGGRLSNATGTCGLTMEADLEQHREQHDGLGSGRALPGIARG